MCLRKPVLFQVQHCMLPQSAEGRESENEHKTQRTEHLSKQCCLQLYSLKSTLYICLIKFVEEELIFNTLGTFHSTKIPVCNFRNSICPMGQYIPVAQTRPKPPCIWSLFWKAGYRRAVLGPTILSKEKGHFGPTDWIDQTGKTFR